MSTAPVRDPKAQRSAAARPGAASRHRKGSRARPRRWGKLEWAAAAAVWCLVVLVFGWGAVQYGGVQSPAQAGAWFAQATGDLGAWSGAWSSPAQFVSAAIASPRGVYRNPLRGVGGLVPERIDDGVDFGGSGPVYALGDAVVTGATSTNFGWPGGGWITYRLTSGPGMGLVVYVAEDITPAVVTGQPQIVSAAVADRAEQYYRNPLREVSGLARERIDEGVDFAGTGPVYALGDAVVTGASGTNYGWPGGGWITYRLTSGPGAGLVVYVGEDITPAVTTGQHVSSTTVVGTMFDGGDGIETGWAQSTGLSAESELPEAGSIAGLGPFPTRVGVNFDSLLQSLGVPGAPNRTQLAFGLLPASYPASW